MPSEYQLTVHEFGVDNPDTLVMFHPLGVRWDIFEYVIPLLETRFHLVIPAIPGFDPDQPKADFTSVEDVQAGMERWLAAHGIDRVACLYGCSMGGGIVARMLATSQVAADCAIIDAGMTPYQLPKIATYAIGVRDWVVMEIGKHMSVKALSGMFDPEKYSDEDLLYVKEVMGAMSSRTVWRSFYSANNYSMPKTVRPISCPVQYWYGDQEKKARAWDIAYIQKAFPKIEFVENPSQDHAEFFTLHPAEFAQQLTEFVDSACRRPETPILEGV